MSSVWTLVLTTGFLQQGIKDQNKLPKRDMAYHILPALGKAGQLSHKTSFCRTTGFHRAALWDWWIRIRWLTEVSPLYYIFSSWWWTGGRVGASVPALIHWSLDFWNQWSSSCLRVVLYSSTNCFSRLARKSEWRTDRAHWIPAIQADKVFFLWKILPKLDLLNYKAASLTLLRQSERILKF